MRASFSLGRIAGIRIGIHYTWLFAFALIAWTLAEGFYPEMFPGWSRLTYWITGVLSALLLFVSVLVHELAHSFVARARGLPVEGITLFIFGGVSNLRGEAERPLDEFAIAVVGPLLSLVLAAIFWFSRGAVEDTTGPVFATLTYLGLVNGLLAIFNIVPGFPLDGGRVLRSIIWGVTGSLRKATNTAALVGQLFGWLLIGYGVFQILQGSFLSGLWTAFIGWFLNSAADASRREVAVQEMFRDVRVRDVMRTDPPTVEPQASLDTLVRECFLRQGIRAAPVCSDSGLEGIVTVSDIKEVPESRWASTTAVEVMTRQPLHSVGPRDDLSRALALMAEHNINQVLVTEDGKLVGMLDRAHIIRYLQSIEELGMTPVRQPGQREKTSVV